MTNHPTRKQPAQYAVVPADGHYGDWADVVSTHGSLAAAKRAAKGNWQVVEIGGTVAKGDRLPRTSLRRVA